MDIIAAAGGVGIFNFSLWAESGFVKKASKILYEYCLQKNINLEHIK